MWKEIVKFDEREAASRIQKTGYCRRCQQMVIKYQKCPLKLPAPPVSPSCPMRGDEENARIIKWLDVLKVEDIDFDKDIRGFGHYGMSSKPLVHDDLFNMVMSGKKPKLKNMVNEEIRINHQTIYRYLQDKLGREPTEREIQEYVIRAIMHEATHAGMGFDQLTMDDAAKEYGAFTGQFPDNIFYRLKQYIDHPATTTQIVPAQIANMLGIRGDVGKESLQEIVKFLAWAEVITDNLNIETTIKDKIKNKLAKLEVTARTQKPRETFSEVIDVDNINTWLKRYGEEHKDFFEKLKAGYKFPNNSITFNDSELKMTGAVSTTSAPAMFNKVVRGRKKRRKKDE